MAVGSITSGLSVTVNSSYVQVSFSYTGTVTGFKAVFTPTTGSAISTTITSGSFSAGSVSWQYTGLKNGVSYSLTVQPVNGTTNGTAVSYSNSSTSNKIVVPAASSTTSTSPSTSASSNGTSTNSQTSIGTPTLIKKTISNIPIGADWILLARVKKVNADGTIDVSDWSSLNYTAGTSGAGGGNLGVINSGTDIKLAGGAIYANSATNPFPKNLGKINLAIYTPPTGSGLILNQSGLGAYSSGTREFFLDGISGKAYFAGTVSLGTKGMKVGPQVDPSGTKSGIYINDYNYWYDDGTFSTSGDQIIGIVKDPVKTLRPGAISNLHATFDNLYNLTVTFNYDTAGTDSSTYSNKNTQQFNFNIIPSGDMSGPTIPFPPGSSTAQSYTFSAAQIVSWFNMPISELTLNINAQDIFGNIGPTASTTASQAVTLPAPIISVSAINNGYQVAASNIPSSGYVDTYIEEYLDTPGSDSVVPSGVTYTQATPETKLNPAIVITPTTAHRWVRARYRDASNRLGTVSDPHPVTPVNPVANNLTTTPPNEVIISEVKWVGDNIEIDYALPSTHPGVRFIISLTTNYVPYNGLYTGYFYLYPDGTGKSVITQDQLLGQFGTYYSSFSGSFKSADSNDIRSNGVSFVVPTKPSALNGVVPDLNTINIFAIPTGYAVQPSLVNGSQYLEVYASTTDFGTNDPQPSDFVGKVSTLNVFSTAYEATPYARHYLKFRFAGFYGDYSLYSDSTYVDPIDPASFSSSAPQTPSVTVENAVTGTNNPTQVTDLSSITITISTSDTVLTKGYYVQYYPDMNMNAMIMNMVPSTAAVTPFLIPNLMPGTMYHISVAPYNDSNILGTYSSDLLVQTAFPTASTLNPTNLAISGIPYGILATWSAPTSPATAIANYAIEVFRVGTPNVFLGVQYTAGTQFSVSGLLPNYSYYYKLYAIDIFGNHSQILTSPTPNVTLNAIGGTSNGLPPSSSPTPVVTPFSGELQVTWPAIPNPDSAVTYEVHVSASNGFTPLRVGYQLISGSWVVTPGQTNSTKYVETQGTFAVIKTLADGTALSYGTPYYVKIVAKDFDGAAAPGTQGTGSPAQINTADIAANAIVANTILAGTITADKMVTNQLYANQTISVGQSTSANRIKLDATLIPLGTTGYSNPTAPIFARMYIGGGYYNDPGTQFYTDSLGRLSLGGSSSSNANALTWDGTSLTLSGAIRAQSGYFAGAITVDGATGSMKIGPKANGTNDGIYIDSSNYWLTSAASGSSTFQVGNGTYGISWTPSSSTFKVTGNVNAIGGTFTGPVTIDTNGTNAGLWAVTYTGSTPNYNTGPRVIINKNGIYAYDYGATLSTTASTQIILASATGTPTFQTNNALIADWYVSGTKIENNVPIVNGTFTGSLNGSTITTAGSVSGILTGMYVSGIGIGTGATVVSVNSGTKTVTLSVVNSATVNGNITFYTNFTGFSGSGAYTIWAGSPAPGGSSNAGFLVTNSGTVVARDITIYGNNKATDLINAGGGVFKVDNTGNLFATSANIAGTITASSGMFTGSVALTTNGNFYGGVTLGVITGVTPSAGTVAYTVTNSGANAVNAGDKVLISGLTPSGYNGLFTAITGTNSTQVVVTNSTTGAYSGINGIVSNVTNGFVLNNLGITFNNGTTKIDAPTGLLTTTSAKIGGWSVGATSITGNGITLDTQAGSTGTGQNITYLPAITANNGSYYVGMAPTVANSATKVVLWAGTTGYSGKDGPTAYPNFRVQADGTLYATGAIFDSTTLFNGKTLSSYLSDYITSSTLNTTLTGYATTSNLASKLSSGGALVAEANGQVIDISSKGITIANSNFKINSSTTPANISLTNTSANQAAYVGGALILNGNGIAAVDTNGKVTFNILSNGNATFSGDVTAGTFNTSDSLNNYWNSNEFKMGTAATYIKYSGSTITLLSGSVTLPTDSQTPDGGSLSTPTITTVTSSITLGASLTLKGIPVLGNNTKYPGGAYDNVTANSNNPTYGMGAGARQRMLVQDPYDGIVYRGMAVYYGSRTTPPSGGTGYIGDLWVSW